LASIPDFEPFFKEAEEKGKKASFQTITDYFGDDTTKVLWAQIGEDLKDQPNDIKRKEFLKKLSENTKKQIADLSKRAEMTAEEKEQEAKRLKSELEKIREEATGISTKFVGEIESYKNKLQIAEEKTLKVQEEAERRMMLWQDFTTANTTFKGDQKLLKYHWKNFYEEFNNRVAEVSFDSKGEVRLLKKGTSSIYMTHDDGKPMKIGDVFEQIAKELGMIATREKNTFYDFGGNKPIPDNDKTSEMNRKAEKLYGKGSV
jgi:hypothetical protein